MSPNYQSGDTLPQYHNERGESSSLLGQRKRCHRDTNDDSNNNDQILILTNDNDKVNENRNDFHNYLGSQMSKRPIVILSMMLFLACMLGHTLTVCYYWDNINNPSTGSTSTSTNTATSSSPMIINPMKEIFEKEAKAKKKLIEEVQAYAMKQKMDELDIPTLESEKYYNKTLALLLSKTYDDGDGNNDGKIDDNSKKKKKKKKKKNNKIKYPIMGESESESSITPVPPPPPPAGCQTTIMILRHCEKGDIREHCNLLGFERAQYISTLFGNGNERWPSPTQIYALAPGKRKDATVQNWREVETVTPLSQKINVPINDSFGLNNGQEFAQHLFKEIRSPSSSGTSNMCDKVILISWKHADIPTLAKRLGCGPTEGCPIEFDNMDFDSTWQIKYAYRKAQYSPYPEAEIASKKHMHKPWGTYPEWWIFGKVEKENFDPLAFSKISGRKTEHM